MNELTEWDIEQIEREINGNQNAGLIVKTKTGLIGRTLYKDELINGKQIVYTDNGKLLCDPSTLIVRGYID